TILNLGINDEVVALLTEWSGDAHFAHDAHRRFIQMYGEVVREIPDKSFEEVLSDLKASRGVSNDSELTTNDLAQAARRFRQIIASQNHEPIPDDPGEQLRAAIEAVFSSWSNNRAKTYRELNDIPDDLGTAANVQMMVFGDLGSDSGTGVCFTRDPSTGEKVPFGDYLPEAQGEDVVAGIRNTSNLDELSRLHPSCHAELTSIMDGLENHFRDMCDIEFTIEKGKLFILQTRAGKRTAHAAVRIAVAMVEEHLIDKETALGRIVDPASLEQLDRARINESEAEPPIAHGLGASPGAAVGKVVFTADKAVQWANAGEDVILVRPTTTPDDLHGMAAAQAILTSSGSTGSHAAVVARGMGKPALVGTRGLNIDEQKGRARLRTKTIAEGDVITVDGTTGAIYMGAQPLIPPQPVPELDILLSWADAVRTLGVWANADTPAEAAIARRAGAEGIGLARTEHMFLGERTEVVRRIILSKDDSARQEALAELKVLQVSDFEGLLEAMDGLPVIVRLLDPPMHEFLPSRLELEQEMYRRVPLREDITDLQEMAGQVEDLEEVNPMMGLRGVRLGLIRPELYLVQTEAAIEAVIKRMTAGGDPQLEIMIPLVGEVEELRLMREMIEQQIEAYSSKSGLKLEIPVGTMIELPRAALIAGTLAAHVDFFSFGTNDLTQMTYGLSRDDAQARFLDKYVERKIFKSNPFQTLDRDGVGRLVRVATREGKEANPGLIVGVCGEHGGDPASIAFCKEVGLDYVSCSPPRVKVARLAAAQAELGSERADV
ncbi:MAG: pyruvate, phosphate dikinase, partial [Acidimicrobiia bacterium]